MANPWFRLWGDMVNDPKWRTIARKSGQSIGNVIAVALHMMTLASNSDKRGCIEGWNDEDIGTALDIDSDQVEAIRTAMQGRTLNGDKLTGWEKRQPLKEDPNAAERAREFRERAKVEAEAERIRTLENATERNRTTDEMRVDEIRDLNPFVPSVADDPLPIPEKQDCPHQKIIDLYHEVLPMCPRVRDWTPARATQLRARWNEDKTRQDLGYWRRFFEYIGSCSFLVGKAGTKPFFADLEWMVKSANFVKIREQKYEDRAA